MTFDIWNRIEINLKLLFFLIQNIRNQSSFAVCRTIHTRVSLHLWRFLRAFRKRRDCSKAVLYTILWGLLWRLCFNYYFLFLYILICISFTMFCIYYFIYILFAFYSCKYNATIHNATYEFILTYTSVCIMATHGKI